MKRPRSSKKDVVVCEPEDDGARDNSEVSGDGLDPRSNEESAVQRLAGADSISEGEDADEDADEDHDGNEETTVDFSKLRGIGDLAEGDDDDDSETAIEVMALADLPGQVIKTHRNDEAALDRKLADIARFETAKPHGDGKLPFRESLSLVMAIEDPLSAELANDDLKREERFAEIVTESVHVGLSTLRQMNVKFRRPSDYFAEMVKSDKHMTKVKSRMLHEKERIDAAQKNRNNRDIRKNKKKMRQAQLEREQGKKQQANQEIKAVKLLNKKRVRDRAAGSNDKEDDDDFPIDLLDVEEMKGGSGKFVKSAARPKANVGRKNDKPTAGVDKGSRRSSGGKADSPINRDGQNSHIAVAGRARGDRTRGDSRGIRKPAAKMGSKKRPGKSRRVKTKSSGRK
jgi:rRNA-processing protein EBP2